MSSSHASPRPKVQPIVARKSQRGRSFSLLYLLPAAFLSIVFHAGLFGAMYISSAPTDPVAVQEAKKELDKKTQDANTPTKSEPKEEPEEAPEAKQDDNLITPPPEDKEVPSIPPDDPNVVADVAVPGEQKPGEKIGIEGGAKDKSPFDVGTPSSPFGDPMGQGGAIDKSLEGGLGALVGSAGGGMGDLKGIPMAGGFEGRSGAAKAEALRQGGGTEASEAAVARGLLFLAKMQQPDGRWRLDGPTITVTEDKSQRKIKIPDPGHVADDVAATAFGLLPFLAAGKTHKDSKDNPFDKPIEKALAYLMRRQDKKTGRFGTGTMYSHGLATIAMCEAYGLTRDPLLKRSAQDAINFIVFAQNGTTGGWHYSPGGTGDLSVVGWQVMALKSGQLAKLDVPEATITKAIKFLDSVNDHNNEGYGYMGKSATPAMSAVGLLCRQYIQFWGPNNQRMIKGVERNIKMSPPNPAHKNMYYYYYATQVMHHFGGDSWKAWNEKMRDHLVASQVTEGDLAGSWSSAGEHHGGAGGRLMQTSLSLLTLEVYYRHLPLFNQQ